MNQYSDPFVVQKRAGGLLVALRLRCPLSLEEVLAAALPGWNRSVEELPYCLIDQHGVVAFLDAVAAIPADAPNRPDLVAKLETPPLGARLAQWCS